VLHIEVGSLAMKFEKALKSVLEKFAKEREEAIRSLAIDAVELESVLGKFMPGYSRLGASDIEYKRVFIVSEAYQVGKLKEELKGHGIEFKTLKEVIEEIISDIDEWKKRQVKKGFRASKQITLPESLWLLNLIDYMKKEGLIAEGSQRF